MSTLAWLFVLIVGILVSFLAGSMAAPRTGRLKALEQEAGRRQRGVAPVQGRCQLTLREDRDALQ
jgi:hypothetical protein